MATWLKLDTGILQDEKISLIREYPDGNELFALWIGLLCLAMKRETDSLYIADGVPYHPEDISTYLKIKLKTVQGGLALFERLGMICTSDDVIMIVNFQKYQSLEKLDRNRELSRERMRKHRAKKLAAPDVTHVVTRNDRNSYATELDIELEEEKEEETKVSGLQPNGIPYSKIIGILNETSGAHYSPKAKATQRMIHARWNEGYRLEDFEKVIKAKYAEWGTDEKMVQYVRPQTLFGTKFESYLQVAKPAKKHFDDGWEVVEEG